MQHRILIIGADFAGLWRTLAAARRLHLEGRSPHEFEEPK